MPEERLQKIISNSGMASRRTAERWIAEGRVAVNGIVTRVPGSRANVLRDEITIDGIPVRTAEHRYFALNKPRGIVTTSRDERGRPTVLDLVPIGDVVLHPVGRLDLDSEGLVLLTSDGNLTNRLTHPSREVEKEYLVAIDRPLSEAQVQRAVRGIEESGERLRWQSARPALPPADDPEEHPGAGGWLLVVLRHGRKREIRRILEALGRRVILLKRIRIGPLVLGQLGSGAFRELSEREVRALYEASAGGTPNRGGRARVRPLQSPDPQPPPNFSGPASEANLPWNVTIDGPAASGKTAVGTALAGALGYELLDTGLMYRAFALAALRKNVPAEDSRCRRFGESLRMEVITGPKTRIMIDGEDVTQRLRDSEIEATVSSYSALPAVRRLMVSAQREAAAHARTVVLGRDIGTVVLPDAPVKIYLDASEATRMRRRELQEAAEVSGRTDSESSRRNIAHRDSVDSTRATSPLRPAPDAVYIDTTDLPLEEVVERVSEVVRGAAG